MLLHCRKTSFMKIYFTKINPAYLISILVVLLLACHTTSAQQTLRNNLFVVAADGTKTLIDGNITIYDDLYCNCVDYDDAWKLTNPGENWGLLRSNTTLVVERRKVIPSSDTTYIRMWNLQQRNYAMQVIARNLNHAGLSGYLKDSYTNTIVPLNLNDTTYIYFSVNANPVSGAQNRFNIIFDNLPQAPLPITFSELKLSRNYAGVSLEFAVKDEMGVRDYTIQHSRDGLIYNDLKHIIPSNTGNTIQYKEDNVSCESGENYYRIKALNTESKISFSSVGKIAGPGAGMGINIYPNPVVNNKIQVQLAVTTEGKYEMIAISSTGLVYKLGSIQANAVQQTYFVNLPPWLQRGIYRVQFLGPDNSVVTKIITVL